MDAAHALPPRSVLDAQGMPAKGSSPEPPRFVDANKPMAKDMSHHLNFVSKNRQPSSLKELYKYMNMPGMITLGGGQC